MFYYLPYTMTLNVQNKLDTCYKVYKCYENILDSYVSDYYVEHHWEKFPRNWQDGIMKDVCIDQLGELLDFTKPIKARVYSLSFLCLRNVITSCVISRKKVDILNVDCVFQEDFIKFFWKNVKLKKRHEINIMAQICYETALKSNCLYLVDIGSGLGHLSRMLSYGFGFKVCTFEANPALCSLATELDNKFEKALKSKSLDHKSTFKTIHTNKRIEHDVHVEEFLKLVKEAFNSNDTNFKFGIVGLHPCGNLGSTLLRLYNECPNATFINIASCCYMKLTLQPSLIIGFPLSSYCRNNNFNLSYLSCEIACHAIENYVEKLKVPQDCSTLKIHAYRAALEKIMISIDEKLKHSAVCNVKYSENLSFKTYCDKALKKNKIVIPEDITSIYEELINKTWKNVVVFYSIRLLLAPLIETIILFDRLLYVEECNSFCNIKPAFDCNISPRNHVLSAVKKYQTK